MQSKKNKTITIITVGFALFAMFFGAGNLILPPYIGLVAGGQWPASLIGFFSTAILAPFLGVLMVAVSGTSFFDLGKKIHPKFIDVLALLIILCIGPMVAIPRTGATTYEIGIAPSFPWFDNIVFSVIFFAVVLALSISQTKIVDIIGKVLTPFLLVSLLALVVLGILYPAQAPAVATLDTTQAFMFGFTEGYQTLDVLASVIFAGIIISAVINSGYTSVGERTKVTIAAGIVSTAALLFIYGGLIYLGATTDLAFTQSVSRTDLLLYISQSILGSSGTYVISVAIAFACLTTAIALTSATGMFVERISSGRISYRYGVIACVLVSAFLSVNSVDEIIRYAVNILLFVYPITFVLIVYVLLFGRLVKTRLPYIAAIVAAAVVSFISVLENMEINLFYVYEFKNTIPLSEHSLEWVLPSFVAFVAFALVSRRMK
ncbi:MAG: branched-chain amino acid transport system II carrier protein [Capnocytophaga sp.]|nr:branched-chain amino acid transport system II carrier protein [Capnocytophaga sp.]